MLVEARELKIGNIIEYNNVFYKITQNTHVKPGKGGAFKQIVAQGLIENKKLENRFRVDEMVNKVIVFEKKIICIQIDENDVSFIDLQEQQDITISKKIINFPNFLQESMECTLLINDDNQYIYVKLPQEVVLKVTSANLSTGSAGEKNITLENGETIKAPQYINTGESITVCLSDVKPKFKSR